jgi:hypothetical protein
VIASRTPASPWRYSPTSSKSESRAKATKGKAGTAGVTGPVRRSTTGTGLRVGVSGAGLTATSEFMDATGRRDAHRIQSLCSANSFSALGSARGTSAMLHPGVVDGLTASLAGRENGDSRRDGTDIPIIAVAGGGSGKLPRAAMRFNGDRREDAWRAPTRNTLGTMGSNPIRQCSHLSSGDGLGIQQPGSITLATRAKVKGQSGRARDRAMCPAVARSFSRRVA